MMLGDPVALESYTLGKLDVRKRLLDGLVVGDPFTSRDELK